MAGLGPKPFWTFDPPPLVGLVRNRWPSGQPALLLALFDTVVVLLGQRLQIVLVPEQISVTPVRDLVIHHRAVGCRILANQHHARGFAYVSVALQHLAPQLLPTRSLVPLAPRLAGIALLGAGAFDYRCRSQAGRHLAKPRLHCG